VEREEKQSGVSLIKKMLAQRGIMFDGIGHADIKVGKQTYKFAFSHKFRGYSYLNVTHAGQRYMRFQGTDREIACMGDIHTPAYQKYFDGPVERLSMVAGTLNVASAYANRYFSIFTQPYFPCVELRHDAACIHAIYEPAGVEGLPRVIEVGAKAPNLNLGGKSPSGTYELGRLDTRRAGARAYWRSHDRAAGSRLSQGGERTKGR
jgi:hypothetical protein